MPEIVTDPPSLSCHHLFSGPRNPTISNDNIERLIPISYARDARGRRF
jgi:hypothetical protein